MITSRLLVETVPNELTLLSDDYESTLQVVSTDEEWAAPEVLTRPPSATEPAEASVPAVLRECGREAVGSQSVVAREG